MCHPQFQASSDKKLLWRANLYIDQPEEIINANGNKVKVADWNDIHPWVTDNEWNRFYNGNQNINKLSDLPEVTITNIADKTKGIPAGTIPGGQVVKFPDWTPLRTLPAGAEGQPTADNKIRGTVAYSFPSQPNEATYSGGAPGGAGSMDSPFDFIWKMKKQQTSLYSNYTDVGVVKSPPNRDTKGWAYTYTPHNKWSEYVKGLTALQFIPSLGLFHGGQAGLIGVSGQESNLQNINEINYWHWNNTFEAGTDCVGFVKRAWSYSNHTGQWSSLLPSFMDVEAADVATKINTVLTVAAANRRTFPVPGGDTDSATTIVHTYAGTDTQKDSLINPSDATQDAKSVELLRRVVPGDIWVKDSTGSNDGFWKEHIAIVAEIPEYREGMTPQAYMDGMILIEGEFTNKIQSVIKKLSVGDYNSNNVTIDKEIYPGFVLKPNTLVTGLNCASWGIRRLK